MSKVLAESSVMVKPSNDSFPKIYPQWHNVAAGAVAGAGARLITAPLDLLKIRRQIIPITAEATSAARESLITTVKQIVRHEGGIRGLFRGNVAATYLWVGYAIVQFSLYARASEFLSSGISTPKELPSVSPFPAWRAIREDIASRPTTAAFISGATAGVCATLITYPFDICRTAFAAQGLIPSVTTMSPPTTILQFSKRMVSKHGYRGFFAGVCPAIIQIIPYMGLNFALYDRLTRLSDRHSAINAGAAGTISGGVSKIIVYPLDTVKKRLQAQTFVSLLQSTPLGTAAVNLSHRNKYKGMVDCIMQTARDESILGFYRGMVPSVMKNAAATGFTFAIFTLAKNALEVAHDSRRRTLVSRETAKEESVVTYLADNARKGKA